MKCISCGAQGNGTVLFCHSCSKRLMRCEKCRKLSIKYKCQCNAEGP